MPQREGQRRRRTLFALLAVCALVGIGAYFFGWPKPRQNVVAEASSLYEQGHFAKAATLAEQRLKTTPNDRKALRLLARSAARQRRDTLARGIYGRLGGAATMEGEDFYLFGSIIERMGDRETARECWEGGLRTAPNHPELLHGLSQAYLRMGRYVQAAQLASQLAKQSGWEARADLLLGRIAYEQDDPTEAAAHLAKALDRDPTAKGAPDSSNTYRKLLARALLRAGRPSEAERPLQAVLANGADPETFWLLSRVHLQNGVMPAALATLGRSKDYRDQVPIAPEPAPFVGSERCLDCHRSIHQTQQNSLHAKTLRRGSELKDLPYPGHPVPDPAKPDVRHTITWSDRKANYEVQEGNTTLRALIDYAIGSDHRGLTLVGHDEKGRARELRLSHYSDGPMWDVTSGHPPHPPGQEGYLGRFLAPDDVHLCLYCHTTTPRAVLKGAGPESADHGIGCERCHGPGGNHIKAVAANFSDMAIPWPGRVSGAPVVALCAQCHSPFAREVAREDPIAVRFPGTNLTWSRCYAESGGTFDCLTCHNPHRNSETTPAFYESKCLSCHSKAATSDKPASSLPSEGRTTCPVNPRQDCLSCHMPTVKTAIPHSQFTDHHIRIRPRTGSEKDQSPPK